MLLIDILVVMTLLKISGIKLYREKNILIRFKNIYYIFNNIRLTIFLINNSYQVLQLIDYVN